MSDDIEANDLLELLKNRGLSVSRTQLVRSQKADLLPRPRQVGLGRGRGSLSYYPPETVDQAVALFSVLEHRRDFERAGWRLWLLGFRVAERYWHEPLRKAATNWDRAIAEIRRVLDSEDEEELDRALDALFHTPTKNSIFKQIRKALGPDRFTEWAVAMLEIAEGTFSDISAHNEGTDADRRKAVRTFDVALGLHQARTGRLRNVPIIGGDYGAVLNAISRQLAGGTISQKLEELNEEELRSAATEIQQAFALLSTVINALEEIAERAYGLPLRVVQFATMSDSELETAMALMWAIYRKSDPGVSNRVATLLASGERLVSLASLTANSKPDPDD